MLCYILIFCTTHDYLSGHCEKWQVFIKNAAEIQALVWPFLLPPFAPISLSLYISSLALCLFVYLNSIGTSSSSKRWKQFTWSYIPRHSIEVYFYLVSFLKGFQEMNFLMTLDFRNIKRFICKQWHFSALEESFSLLLSLSYMPEERVVSRYM